MMGSIGPVLYPISGMIAIPGPGVGYRHHFGVPRMTLAKNLRAAMDAHPDLDTIEKLVNPDCAAWSSRKRD